MNGYRDEWMSMNQNKKVDSDRDRRKMFVCGLYHEISGRCKDVGEFCGRCEDDDEFSELLIHVFCGFFLKMYK